MRIEGVIMYICRNMRTGVTTEHSTLRGARNKAERLNADYGAHIAFVRPKIEG